MVSPNLLTYLATIKKNADTSKNTTHLYIISIPQKVFYNMVRNHK